MEFEDTVDLVITIPKNKLWLIKNEPIKQNFSVYELASYIAKGIELPEPHGDLKDADVLKLEMAKASNTRFTVDEIIDLTDTVIKAKKGTKG